MRKISPAKRAASSPPVPARISRSTFFSSFGSFGIEEEGDLGVEGVALRLEGAGLLVGHLAQLGVRLAARHLLDLGELLERVLVGAVALDDRADLLRLARELLVGGRVLGHGGVGHRGLDLGEAGLDVPELLEGDPVHAVARAEAGPASGLGGGRPSVVAAYLRLKRSTRPAASRSRCLPVKNGWQLEQISSRSSFFVERVVQVAPQAQWTLTTS